ncbi:PAS domain-containing sensor histidine kinase [Phenylobacterium aquaticum]|uniref:hybrid sensor histidine kinase/response regulator n=1 Tax=Phenylobacterium aquaticum TaxID=1763816 RepID=UPI0026ECFA73|nr:PAS domain-containing sensor histidine kinase [Phenylobacterium aquaticum]
MTAVEWPLRFISRRSPPLLHGLAVTVAALAGAIATRGLIIGWPNAAGLSATYFPAYILATLYGGQRWGWGALATSMLLGALSQNTFPNGVSTGAVMVMFALSGALTVMVASALRETLLRYEEARRAQQITQQALNESEARLRLAQEIGGVGLWDWDLATDEVIWSAATYRNLGLEIDRPAGVAAILETAHPDDRARVLAALKSIRDGRMETTEYRVVRGDGSVHWLMSRGDFLRAPDGQPLRALGVNIDVTERRQAFEQIQESEARFRALADSAPVLMWVSRPGGQREFVNQAYVDYLGVPYEQAVDFDWRERLDPEDLPRILKEQVAGEAARQLFTLEARYQRFDGAWRWIRSFSQPRRGPDGGFEGFIGIAFDVTDAKRAETDLKQINELLATRVREALVERDEAETALRHAQRMEAVGQLTGGVAHDFNNLLTVIIGALDLMQRSPGDEIRRGRMVEAALGAARRGERLTQQLLAFSRRQALRPEPVEIDTALREAEPLLRRAVGEAVSLNFTTAAGRAVAMIDASQFHAALMNLVVNARDAVTQGGAIRVETAVCEVAEGQALETPPGTYVRVSVHDTGVGMDADTLSRVFEPFFTTKEVGKGTGLGLSQVYGFARQSGGGVAIESAPGQGASVRLFLPLSAARAAEPPTPSPAAAQGRALAILLVEDDLEVAEMVAALLAEQGHAVTHAPGTDAALDHLGGDRRIDLMLTDLIMPGPLTGVDLAHRAVGLRPSLPVLLASGYTGDALAAADGAPWPLLRKPFSGDALARAIAGVLEPAHKPA